MDAGFLKITQCARRLAHKLYSLSSTEQRTMAEIKEKKKEKRKSWITNDSQQSATACSRKRDHYAWQQLFLTPNIIIRIPANLIANQ